MNKALYGLKQAPRAWYDSLKHTLLNWGFQRSKSDSSLFYFKKGTQVLFILVYVDDILVTGSCNLLINHFVKELNTSFALKDLGEIDYFLGIEVMRNSDGIFLTQTKYITDLLDKLKLSHLRPCGTPAVVYKTLSMYEGKPMHNPTLFRSTIGALHYLAHTRPDIAYIVNKLSQFMQIPTDSHWKAVKRVLRYLQGTKSYSLQIRAANNQQLTAFSDADWACNPDN